MITFGKWNEDGDASPLDIKTEWKWNEYEKIAVSEIEKGLNDELKVADPSIHIEYNEDNTDLIMYFLFGRGFCPAWEDWS